MGLSMQSGIRLKHYLPTGMQYWRKRRLKCRPNLREKLR
jgi:hypothetical protein